MMEIDSETFDLLRTIQNDPNNKLDEFLDSIDSDSKEFLSFIEMHYADSILSKQDQIGLTLLKLELERRIKIEKREVFVKVLEILNGLKNNLNNRNSKPYTVIVELNSKSNDVKELRVLFEQILNAVKGKVTGIDKISISSGDVKTTTGKEIKGKIGKIHQLKNNDESEYI